MLTIIAALFLGALSVVLAIFIIRWSERPGRPPTLSVDLVAPCIFLFRDGQLIDATEPARIIMGSCAGGDLAALRSWLMQRFGDISALDRLAETGGQAAISTAGSVTPMRLTAQETDDGALRLILVQNDAEHAGVVVDSLSQYAMEQELALLRAIVDDAPMMITRRDDAGRITWANAAYLKAAEQDEPSRTQWPLPDILSPDSAPAPDGISCRASITTGDGRHWFDCYDHGGADGLTTYALPADAEVRAEQSLREFLQTLTKTFADLPIGLAIFDRERQLQLFNPALIDLTGLSASFLTCRPSLFSFLDQLRELRMVPEPRDYRSWRRQITTLESAAAAGHHVENWSLPGGRTYRVTGRPHPGGAIAFLFEDITSEVTLTRKFRAELILGAQVLDGLEQALIVFNAVGQVVASNRAYADLWGDAPDRLGDAFHIWRGEWADAPGLQALEQELGREDTAGPGSGVIFGPGDRGVLNWVVTALPGGKRMVTFASPSPGARPAQRRNPEQRGEPVMASPTERSAGR
ncbi:MAG: PAS-domain containing protein [Paracoccus sp. (in: a-proteobacteria)]|nr:PAS-domain containing protein [Paracoccus sp. (in: a-proteobacteria)]